MTTDNRNGPLAGTESESMAGQPDGTQDSGVTLAGHGPDARTEPMTAREKAERVRDLLFLLHDKGASARSMAGLFGVSPSTISRWLRAAGRSSTLSDQDRAAVVGYVHRLHHAGRSYRQILADLADRGIDRSLGWVSTAVNDWTCADCSDVSPDTSEQVAGRAEPADQRSPVPPDTSERGSRETRGGAA